MAKKKQISLVEPTSRLTFAVTDDQMKKIAEWKQAHDTIFGYCDDSEYEYVFTVVNSQENKYSLCIKNTYHDTDLDLSEDL